MSEKVIAFTGAGISKPSGIPTFKEQDGIRDYLRRKYFNNKPKRFYEKTLEMKEVINKAEPNDAHKALAKYNVPVITMNIDNLHREAGTEDLLEIHGNMNQVYCNYCGNHYEFEKVKEIINCPDCDELLHHGIVLYGDMIPSLFKAEQMVRDEELDRLIIVGTSFYTSTANHIKDIAKANKKKVTIINEKAEEKLPKLLKEIFN